VLYSYDANGNMLSLTPPHQTDGGQAGKPAHLFAYNKDNKPTVYLPPLLDGDTTATQYRYDAEGRLR
jgi:YD repeat-containing protein